VESLLDAAWGGTVKCSEEVGISTGAEGKGPKSLKKRTEVLRSTIAAILIRGGGDLECTFSKAWGGAFVKTPCESIRGKLCFCSDNWQCRKAAGKAVLGAEGESGRVGSRACSI